MTTQRPNSRGPGTTRSHASNKVTQLQLPIITVVCDGGRRETLNIDCHMIDLHSHLVKLLQLPTESLVELCSEKGMVADIQSLLGEDAAGSRADTVLKKGGTYVCLRLAEVDYTELAANFKTAKASGANVKTVASVQFIDDPSLAQKLFTPLIDPVPKDFILNLPKKFSKTILEERTIAALNRKAAETPVAGSKKAERRTSESRPKSGRNK